MEDFDVSESLYGNGILTYRTLDGYEYDHHLTTEEAIELAQALMLKATQLKEKEE